MEIDWKLREVNGGWTVETAIRFDHAQLAIDDLDAISAWLRLTSDHFKATDAKPVDGKPEVEELPATKPTPVIVPLIAKAPAKSHNGTLPKRAAAAAPPAKRPQTGRVMKYLTDWGSASALQISDDTGLAEQATMAILSRLVKIGKVQQTGRKDYKGKSRKVYALAGLAIVENGHE